MSNKDILLDKALKIIADNMGEYTANLYRDFYKDKDAQTIAISVKELLVEIIGENNANELVKEL